jgi:translation initiation factor 1
MGKKSDPKKIELNTGGILSAQPFAGLNLAGLPDGPQENPAPVQNPQTAKLGRVVLRRETAHRGGKTVIVVDGFAPTVRAECIEELSKKLRKACGCGGAVRERAIELQGDQPARIRALLEAEGYQVAGERDG